MIEAGKVYLACGAYLAVPDVAQHKVGDRVKVYTSPHQGHRRPVSGDVDSGYINCLVFCPALRAESGRREKQEWFEQDQRGWSVTCQVQRVEADED